MGLDEYIESIKSKKICVIGIGVSNEPWIKRLAAAGCSVTACDRSTRENLGALGDELESMGVKLKLGDDYLEHLDADIIFRTPGLMPFDPHLEEASKNGAEITSEMELFFKLCPCRIFAVTGSDGKSTTTTLISELLKGAGYTVHLGGNIGRPLLCDVPDIKESDVAVLELSSFQLHSMECRPDVAVITNISPNHLDKHKGYEDYIYAKKFIFSGQHPEDTVVLNLDDELVASFANEAPSKVKYFSFEKPVENGAFLRGDGMLCRAENGAVTEIIHRDDIYIPGDHNVKNFLAAFSATEGFVPNEVCAETARTFKGLEHRLETFRIHRGVRYINDSIASSPTRTIAGLYALKTKPIIILGGYDKHIPFDGLGSELCKMAKSVVITGATGEKIYTAMVNAPEFDGCGVPVARIDDFDEAVMYASNQASEGDIVILSPACASFDRFKNFAVRGNYFKKIIMELEE